MKITKLIIVVLAAGALTLTACGKDDKGKTDKKAETKDGDKAKDPKDRAMAKPADGTKPAGETKPAEETPKPPEAAGDAPSEEQLAKAAEMFTKVDAAITSGADCKAKAEGVTKVFGEYGDFLGEMKKFDKKTAMGAFAQKHGDVLSKMAAWAPVQKECPEVNAALEVID